MLFRFMSRVPALRALPAIMVLGLGLGAFGCGSDDDPGETPGGQCKADSECSASAATPFCNTSAGVCVACKENAHCAGATPVCEQESLTCRACSADTECGSGVCLATAGTCALPDQLIYVKQGGMDTGLCDSAAAACSMNYAKGRASASRNVLRVLGNLTQPAELQGKFYVDGDGGTWSAASGVVLSVGTQAGDVTVEGLSLQGPDITNTFPTVQCQNGASLRLHQAQVKLGTPAISAACKLSLSESKVLESRGSIDCMDGSLSIETSELNAVDRRSITTARCSVKLSRNKISANPGPAAVVDIIDAPMLTIENNLILDRTTLTSTGLSITNAPTGGAIRFNTVVNSKAGAHTGEGIACVGTSVVSSNVIAWLNGPGQVTNACARRYNAFDSMTPLGVGEGNTQAAVTALFVDPAGDFHPLATSPSLGLADPNDKVPVDLDGKARPASGRLDAGAYEIP